MYKLFLCLRYLRRRYLALIAVAAVALCVFMVLVAVSVMDGFLRKVETAARGLFGDIIVDATSLSALGRYDEFMGRLTGQYRLDAPFELADWGVGDDGLCHMAFRAKATYAQVEALAGKLSLDKELAFPARAAVLSGDAPLADVAGELSLSPDRGLLFGCKVRLKGEQIPQDKMSLRPGPVHVKVGPGIEAVESATPVIYSYGLLRIGTNYTATVQIFGIRLPERLAVTDFEDGLFVQTGQSDASFNPSLEQMLVRTRQHLRLIEDALKKEMAKDPGKADPDLTRKLRNAHVHLMEKAFLLDNGLLRQRLLRELESLLAAERAKPAGRRDDGEIKRLTDGINLHRAELQDAFRTPANHMMLGLGLAGLSFRTPAGQTVRVISPGQKAILTLLPMGRGRLSTSVTPNTQTFVVVDDAETGVFPFDSKTVYVPFEKLQLLADMDERRDADDPANVDPARCSQIQIKVKPAFASPAKLRATCRQVRAELDRFLADRPGAASAELIVHTWREKLAKFIGPIQKQRTLVALMFGIISLVSVLLIFAIFYMIVMQKVRDIGVIRAVGGSAAGVAQIFLAYGAATGVVGSILGLTSGYFFVRYINTIQDFVDRTLHFRVWDRDVFLFDTIPNEVDPAVMAVIAAWAIVSGLVGALIPAVRAATMEPAEAVRYE